MKSVLLALALLFVAAQAQQYFLRSSWEDSACSATFIAMKAELSGTCTAYDAGGVTLYKFIDCTNGNYSSGCNADCSSCSASEAFILDSCGPDAVSPFGKATCGTLDSITLPEDVVETSKFEDGLCTGVLIEMNVAAMGCFPMSGAFEDSQCLGESYNKTTCTGGAQCGDGTCNTETTTLVGTCVASADGTGSMARCTTVGPAPTEATPVSPEPTNEPVSAPVFELSPQVPPASEPVSAPTVTTAPTERPAPVQPAPTNVSPFFSVPPPSSNNRLPPSSGTTVVASIAVVFAGALAVILL